MAGRGRSDSGTDSVAPSPTRQAAFRRGRRAELWGRLWLMAKFYRVVGVDRRFSEGEIDLIVRRGRVLAFVEVKARDRRDQALAAISLKQRRRIERAAAQFLAQHPHYSAFTCRFDALLIARGRWPRHLPDAWRP